MGFFFPKLDGCKYSSCTGAGMKPNLIQQNLGGGQRIPHRRLRGGSLPSPYRAPGLLLVLISDVAESGLHPERLGVSAGNSLEGNKSALTPGPKVDK